jgi:hypothetical protein
MMGILVYSGIARRNFIALMVGWKAGEGGGAGRGPTRALSIVFYKIIKNRITGKPDRATLLSGISHLSSQQ